MAQYTLYNVPQAYFKSGEGERTEFAGLVEFGEDTTKSMMWNTITAKGGLFGGNIGSPPPSKVTKEEIPEYMKLLQNNPDVHRLNHKIKEKITTNTPWPIEELRQYINSVTGNPTDMINNSSSSANSKSDEENNTILALRDREKELIEHIQTLEKENQALAARKDNSEPAN